MASSECTFHPPSLPAWMHAVTVHGSLMVAWGLPLGLFLYWTPKKWRKHVGLASGLATAVAFRLLVVDVLDRRTAHPGSSVTWMGVFLADIFSFSTFFKCIAVAFAQFPDGADRHGVVLWLIWFVSLPEPVLAKGKFRKATVAEVGERAKLMAYKIVGLFFLLSFLLNPQSYGRRYYVDRLPFPLSIVVGGYIHMWFIYLMSAFCLDFSNLLNVALSGGYSFQAGFRDPMLGSRSAVDIWGARWDLPVQGFLKRSVYLPVRRAGWSRAWAVMISFLASGLLHEYNLSFHNASHYVPGAALLFFACMGLLIFYEQWLWRVSPEWLNRFVALLPTPIVCATIMLCYASGLFELLFVRSWIQAGALQSIAELLPHMVCP